MQFLHKHGVKWLGLLIGLMFLFQILPGLGQVSSSAAAKPALYDFGRGQCIPCIEMEKILASIKSKYGDQIEVRMVMAEKDKDLFLKFKIVGIPTQVFLDASGKEVDRHMGIFAENDLVKKLQDLKFIN
jgi:thioredoxin 1